MGKRKSHIIKLDDFFNNEKSLKSIKIRKFTYVFLTISIFISLFLIFINYISDKKEIAVTSFSGENLTIFIAILLFVFYLGFPKKCGNKIYYIWILYALLILISIIFLKSVYEEIYAIYDSFYDGLHNAVVIYYKNGSIIFQLTNIHMILIFGMYIIASSVGIFHLIYEFDRAKKICKTFASKGGILELDGKYYKCELQKETSDINCEKIEL